MESANAYTSLIIKLMSCRKVGTIIMDSYNKTNVMPFLTSLITKPKSRRKVRIIIIES